ncbi:hypothetical protein S40288_06847 [Stachybotrys chartarum IBT 40288]|nr:hypothetical protein S40288_06847 [Stachybotrys chartarum IBT 40288]
MKLLPWALYGPALVSAALLSAAPGVAVSLGCCEALAASLGSKVFLPDSTAYDESVGSYWSAQEQSVRPACILGATSANDVSVALKLLVPKSCRFATRGGGHGALAGLANIENGVTIDLRGLDSVKLLPGNRLVALGSGLSVGDTYAALYPFGVAISAGRSYDVGVSGSTLGGGLGWLSSEAGFACDNVVEYEVVIADGSIVTATQTRNVDLWRALKGGGNNFGIVTRFVFLTVPLGQIWNEDVVYALDNSQLPKLFDALFGFTSNLDRDPKASVLLSSSYSSQFGYSQFIQSVYNAPVDSRPAVFNGLFSVPGQQLYSFTNETTLPDLSYNYNLNTPDGLQQVSFSMSLRNNLDAIMELNRISQDTVATIADVQGLSWALSFQPLTSLMTDITAVRGGNVLGIGQAPPEGLYLALLTIAFASRSDYERVGAAADQMLAKSVVSLKKYGVFNQWVEMSHAGARQNPISSYGIENRLFLLRTAQKYDPYFVFQRLMPGGYKLKKCKKLTS